MKLEKHLIKKKYDGHLLSRQIPVFEFSGDRCTSNPTAGYFQSTAEVSYDTPEWNEKFSAFEITGSELTGNNYRFDNSDVEVKAVYETAKNVTLNRCNSTKVSGFIGDTATLSNDTPVWNEKFTAFTITGSNLTGNDFEFTGSDITAAANYETAKNVTLNTDGHGKIESTKASGFIGDTASLSNTASAGYTFTGYTTTGAVLTGSNFIFTGSDITAHAGYSANVYNITLQNDGHGTIAANKTTGNIGDTITLSNTPATHYHFSGYTVTGATLTSNKFNLGAQNATAKGWFSEDPKYTLTLQTDGHGKISAGKTTGYAGDTTTLSNTASAGYAFKNYTVTGCTLNGSTITFNSQNCTAKVNFSALPKTFTITGRFSPMSSQYDSLVLTAIGYTGVPVSSDVLFAGTVKARTGTSYQQSVDMNGYKLKTGIKINNFAYKMPWGITAYGNDTICSWTAFTIDGAGQDIGNIPNYGGGTHAGTITGSYSTYTVPTANFETKPLFTINAVNRTNYTATFSATGVLV